MEGRDRSRKRGSRKVSRPGEVSAKDNINKIQGGKDRYAHRILRRCPEDQGLRADKDPGAHHMEGSIHLPGVWAGMAGYNAACRGPCCTSPLGWMRGIRPKFTNTLS